MKKVKFDNSLSLQQAFAGRQMPPILILEGWLVDEPRLRPKAQS